ncbi:hypothetical protein BU24DRAFT_330864, partial [Aaosphaeria arxii CBS 175.79]
LPTELVEAIASYLPLTDFRRLRLLCSSLTQQVHHQFKHRFFQQHTLDWTVAGFQTLSNIVNDDQFRSSLQSIVIVSTPLQQMRLWMASRRAVASLYPGPQTEPSEEEIRLTDETNKAAKFWNESRHDYTSLTATFERLRSIDSIVFAYDGMDKTWSKFGRFYCERSTNEMSRPFIVTMAAIAESHFHVRTMTMHEEKKYGAVGIGRLESLAPRLSTLQDALGHIQTLRLNLRDWRSPEEGFDPPVRRTPFVVRFLSCFKNLRSFEFSCYSSLEDNIFSEMATHCKFPYLERCDLGLIRLVSMDDLFNFLNPAKGHLRSLTLSNMVLRDETVSWSDLL